MPFKPMQFFVKTSILTSFCMLGLLSAVSAQTLIQVAVNPVDFGEIKQGGTATAKFQLSNTGAKQLTIQFMEFSVPGMRASVQPTIAAGASTEVVVTWNTSQLEGQVEGETILTLNDQQIHKITLTINGTVIP